MARGNELRRSMRALRQNLEARVRRAAGSGTANVNVVRRRNTAISANIGEDGAVHGASSRQYAPIHQDGEQAKD